MNNTTVKGLVQNNYSTLHQAEKKAADHTLSHAHEVVSYSVTELLEKSHASEATIVRTCKRLGYQGYYHLKIALAKEVINPDNSYPGNTNFTDVTLLAILLSKKQAEDSIRSTQFFSAEVLESTSKLLVGCDTTLSSAAGNSSPPAVYGAYKSSQLGLKTVVHVSPEVQINATYSAGRRDLMIGIFNPSSTNLMVDILKMVKKRGVKSVCTTGYIKSPLSKLSTHQLNTMVNDKIFFEVFDSTRVPVMGVIDMLVLLFMYKNRACYEKYRTREEFLGPRFKR